MRILLDSNILIYFLNGNKRIIKFLRDFDAREIGLSAISYAEILTGYKKHIVDPDFLKKLLAQYIILPFTGSIGEICASFLAESKKYLFNDAAISATAIYYGLPLVTNNPKDFRKFSGLKIITPRN